MAVVSFWAYTDKVILIQVINMDIKKPLSRRNFLKNTALAVGSVSVLSKILNNEQAFAQTPAVALDENNPTAIALGYKHDANAIDVAKFPKRATADGKKQFCDNCMFYSMGGQKVTGHDGEFGKCTLFPTGLVAAKGWCNSWALKPGATL